MKENISTSETSPESSPKRKKVRRSGRDKVPSKKEIERQETAGKTEEGTTNNLPTDDKPKYKRQRLVYYSYIFLLIESLALRQRQDALSKAE